MGTVCGRWRWAGVATLERTGRGCQCEDEGPDSGSSRVGKRKRRGCPEVAELEFGLGPGPPGGSGGLLRAKQPVPWDLSQVGRPALSGTLPPGRVLPAGRCAAVQVTVSAPPAGRPLLAWQVVVHPHCPGVCEAVSVLPSAQMRRPSTQGTLGGPRPAAPPDLGGPAERSRATPAAPEFCRCGLDLR